MEVLTDKNCILLYMERYICISGSQLGVIFALWGYLAVSGVIFGCHKWGMLLTAVSRNQGCCETFYSAQENPAAIIWLKMAVAKTDCCVYTHKFTNPILYYQFVSICSML